MAAVAPATFSFQKNLHCKRKVRHFLNAEGMNRIAR
jgi:hypothetical protein